MGRLPSLSGLEKAILIAGSQGALAQKLGVKQAHVWYWLHRSRKGTPAEHVLRIEQLTGIPRHELRPDLYPSC